MRRQSDHVSGLLVTASSAIFAASLVATQASAATLTNLYSFCSQENCADGAAPSGGLIMDGAGNLFGTTSLGGQYSHGAVFELSPDGSTWSYQVLYSFCAEDNCLDGDAPLSPLILDADGNLYGTTHFGGKKNTGIAFELIAPAPGRNWKLKTLYAYCSRRARCLDGGSPSPLTYAGEASGARYDGQSPLFGAAFLGGTAGGGTAFRILPQAGHKNRYAIIYNFGSLPNGADGYSPGSKLLASSTGTLFGTTELGGSTGHGTAYELAPKGRKGWQETILYSFCQQGSHCKDGDKPISSVTADEQGHLFGTTIYGGTCRYCGTDYKLAPNGSQYEYSVVYGFCSQPYCSDGKGPATVPALDPSGNLIGSTLLGGNQVGKFKQGAGVVYSFSGGTLEVLHAFCAELDCTDGAAPSSEILLTPSGQLIGTTSQGGDSNQGTVFEITL